MKDKDQEVAEAEAIKKNINITSARQQAIEKKMQRMVEKEMLKNKLDMDLKAVQTQIAQMRKNLKEAEAKEERIKQKIKIMEMPSDNLSQNQLVDSFVEFQSVSEPKRGSRKGSM